MRKSKFCTYRLRPGIMEHVFTQTLLFITLIQLCRPELPGAWYSANVINEGDFSPKPISDIFTTTGPSFSSTNPIVILPPSTSLPGISTYSTQSPNIPSSSFITEFTPKNIEFTTPSTFPDFSDPSNPPPSFKQFSFPQHQNAQQFPSKFFETYEQAAQAVEGLSSSNSPPTSTASFPTSTMTPEIFSQTSSPYQVEVTTPHTTLSTLNPVTTTMSTFPPQFSNPQTTFSTLPPRTTFSTFSPITSTISSTISSIPPTMSTVPSTLSTFPSTISTFPSTMSTFPSTISTFPSTMSSSPFTTFPPTISTLRPSLTRTGSSSTRRPNTIITTPTFIVPCNNTVPLKARPGSISDLLPLRIRMVAPSGSITNININPASTPSPVTTKRTTTTRRPTTTRRRRTKKNRNTYDGCVNACGQRRAPMCAIPLSAPQIDPNTLKGFPSVCHMSCHNSFRTPQYEMLVDGRCGKLRTRIRTIDSNVKLNRIELNKAQYTIVENPETIVEVSKG